MAFRDAYNAASRAIHASNAKKDKSKKSEDDVAKTSSPHFPSIVDIQCGEKAILL